MTAPVTSLAAARTASSTAAPAITITIAATAGGTSLAPAFRTRDARFYRRYYSIYTVEVRLIIGIELGATFDHRRGRALRNCVRHRRWYRISSFIPFWRWRSPSHFCALLFQDRLPRQLDPIAFHGQNFHQHLVAFFQFIANIFDSVFGNLADMQQAVQARQNFDERPEIRQAAHLA
jgi:hypothetical protein